MYVYIINLSIYMNESRNYNVAPIFSGPFAKLREGPLFGSLDFGFRSFSPDEGGPIPWGRLQMLNSHPKATVNGHFLKGIPCFFQVK